MLDSEVNGLLGAVNALDWCQRRDLFEALRERHCMICGEMSGIHCDCDDPADTWGDDGMGGWDDEDGNQIDENGNREN